MCDETHQPACDPQTPEAEDPLAGLSPEDQEIARRLMAWSRDMQAAKADGPPLFHTMKQEGRTLRVVVEKSDFVVERVVKGTPEYDECRRVIIETTNYLATWPAGSVVFRLAPSPSNKTYKTHRKEYVHTDGTRCTHYPEHRCERGKKDAHREVDVPNIYGVAVYGVNPKVARTVCASPLMRNGKIVVMKDGKVVEHND